MKVINDFLSIMLRKLIEEAICDFKEVCAVYIFLYAHQ